ncbi:MAG: hypothetical protein MUC34_00070 [Anaerolineae bacterium]|jgi:hypothetical protein|nr:hypothetical protein [Anaerolineae bacterium]
MSVFDELFAITNLPPELPVLGLGTLESANHGSQCDCTLLASACHVATESITFEFCKRVLAKHWTLRCRHGEQGSTAVKGHHLPPLGPLDRVGGILVQGLPLP